MFDLDLKSIFSKGEGKVVFTEEYFINHADTLSEDSWRRLSRSNEILEFSKGFFSRFHKNINWYSVLEQKEVSVDYDFMVMTHKYWKKTDLPASFLYPEAFVHDYPEKCNWDNLTMYKINSDLFNREFIRKFKDRLNWDHLSGWYEFSDEEIVEFADYMSWESYSLSTFDISYYILDRFHNELRRFMKRILNKKQIDKAYLLERADSLPMDMICRYQKDLPVEFIEKYADTLHWDNVSRYQYLHEDTLLKYFQKVNWVIASEYQVLSQEFVTTHRNLVHYNKIGKTFPLSDEFIIENQDKLDWYHICQYQNMDVKTLTKCKKRLVWQLVSRHQRMSPQFVVDNGDKINFDELVKNEDANLSKNQREVLKKIKGKLRQ